MLLAWMEFTSSSLPFNGNPNSLRRSRQSSRRRNSEASIEAARPSLGTAV
jgi:hypothetical protein